MTKYAISALVQFKFKGTYSRKKLLRLLFYIIDLDKTTVRLANTFLLFKIACQKATIFKKKRLSMQKGFTQFAQTAALRRQIFVCVEVLYSGLL
jgi:hypothetical protein